MNWVGDTEIIPQNEKRIAKTTPFSFWDSFGSSWWIFLHCDFPQCCHQNSCVTIEGIVQASPANKK
jgi:hypothetical protein